MCSKIVFVRVFMNSLIFSGCVLILIYHGLDILFKMQAQDELFRKFNRDELPTTIEH